MKTLIWDEAANHKAKIACLGQFDGFHLGHLKLINCLMEIKAKQDLAALFFTMSQSVSDFLNQTNTKLLDNHSKQEIAAKLGFDYYLAVPVTREFMNLSAQQFLTILKERFNVIKIVIGSDFRFGKNREGDFNQIITFFGKENVYLIPRQDNFFSSTTIRNLLLNHDLPAANKLLYEDYHLCGEVKKGNQLGRKINFPTANIYLPKKVILPYGVYITETCVAGNLYQSMTSYRLFEGQEVVETYLLDVNLDLYGQEIVVYFKKYLRKNINIKINDLTELVALLKQDLADTLAFFANKA